MENGNALNDAIGRGGGFLCNDLHRAGAAGNCSAFERTAHL
jgi:hypothetical protein